MILISMDVYARRRGVHVHSHKSPRAYHRGHVPPAALSPYGNGYYMQPAGPAAFPPYVIMNPTALPPYGGGYMHPAAFPPYGGGYMTDRPYGGSPDSPTAILYEGYVHPENEPLYPSHDSDSSTALSLYPPYSEYAKLV